MDNTAIKGRCGGALPHGPGPALHVDCVVAGNEAWNAGGGVAVDAGTAAVLERCLITGGRPRQHGDAHAEVDFVFEQQGGIRAFP